MVAEHDQGQYGNSHFRGRRRAISRDPADVRFRCCVAGSYDGERFAGRQLCEHLEVFVAQETLVGFGLLDECLSGRPADFPRGGPHESDVLQRPYDFRRLSQDLQPPRGLPVLQAPKIESRQSNFPQRSWTRSPV